MIKSMILLWKFVVNEHYILRIRMFIFCLCIINAEDKFWESEGSEPPT